MGSHFWRTAVALTVLSLAGVGCGPERRDASGGAEPESVGQVTSALGMSPGTWHREGPAPILSTFGDPFPGMRVDANGSINAIAPDPDSADVLVVGAANGGIWKTVNATDPGFFPRWTAVGDFLPSLSIRVIARDSTDKNVMVAGTGTSSSLHFIGAGIGYVYQSTDGGDTWNVVSDPNKKILGDDIYGITVRSGVILVAAHNRRLFRRTATDSDWTSITSGASGDAGADFGVLYDLVADPSSASRYYLLGRGGVFRSTDSGQNWTNISDTDAADLVPGQPLHLAQGLPGSTYGRLAIGNDGRLYVSFTYDDRMTGRHLAFVSYTTNQGQSWTAMDLPRFPFGASGSTQAPQAILSATATMPIVIRTAAPHNLRLPAHVRIRGVTGNPAANGDWVAIAPPTTDGAAPRNDEFALVDAATGAQSDGTAGTDMVGPSASWQPWFDVNQNGQGENQTTLAVDPTDSSIVYLGGDAGTQFFAPGGLGSGMLLRGSATVPAAGVGGPIPPAQWTNLNGSRIPELPGGGTANGTSPHSDSRRIAFDAAGNLIHGCDGGIFKRSSPRDNSGDFTNLAGDIQTAELHDIAFDPLFGVVFGGAQDNGTSKQTVSADVAPADAATPLDRLAWLAIGGGDGGDVAVATLDDGSEGGTPTVVAYTASQDLGNFRRWTLTGPNQPSRADDPAFSVVVGLNVMDLDGGTDNLELIDDRPFITRFVLNSQNPHRMIIGGKSVAYESFDDGENLTPLQDSTGAPAGGADDADEYRMAYGHPLSQGALWIASPTNATGLFVRLSDGQPLDPVAPPSAGVLFRDVAMAPGDPSSAYLVSATDVYATSVGDGGARVWTPITGDLPSASPGSLHVIRYIKSPSGDRIVVGTDTGVFIASVANPVVWSRVGDNLPHAIVFDMDYKSDPAKGLDRLVVGTLGRGAWSIDNVTQLNQAPRAVCHDVMVSVDATCQATVAATAIDAGSTDPDGGPLARAVSVGSGDPAPTVTLGLGTNTVTLTVTDPQGASASCTAQVTVADTTPPTIGTAANITRAVCSPSFEVMTLTPPTATDNCMTPSVTGQIIASTNPGLRLPLTITGNQAILGPGVHTIRWTASDGSNPGTSSTQTVTIRPGVYATQSAALRDGARLQLASGGLAMLMESGSGGVTVGNDDRASEIWSGGAVALGDRDGITGAIRSTSTIRTGNQDTIGGPVVQNSPLSFPPPLAVNITFPSQNQGNIQVFGGQSRSIGPGAYNGVTVFSNGTLTLNGAGQYFMNSLDLEPQGRILLNQAAGAVLINIRNSLIFRGSIAVSAGVLDGFRTAYFGTSMTTLEAPYNGIFVAPNASVALGGTTPQTFTGQFFVRQLELRPGDTIICRGD